MTTTIATLLENVHSLGMKLSTDGIRLIIDAPKGVMTPALWNQLANQKQELMSVIGTVHLDHVSVKCHEEGLTLKQYVQSIRPRYTPATLPTLPRSQCPFRLQTFTREKGCDHVISLACRGTPLKHGWCAEHECSYELLCLGALLCYPPLSWEYRAIGRGIVQWEAYAERISRVHVELDIVSIRLLYHIQDVKETSTREEDI